MKKYFILAAVAATFAACSFDKDMGESSSQIAQGERIPLGIGVSGSEGTATTRAVYSNIQTDSLNKNTALGLFIIGQGKTPGANNTSAIATTPESYEVINYKLGVNTTGYFIDTDQYSTFSSVTQSDGSTVAALYYPDDKAVQLGLFAYAPHITLACSDGSTHTTSFASAPAASTDLNAGILTVTPYTDQTTELDYVMSDVLWGKQGYGETYDITATNYLAAKNGTAKAGFYTGSVTAQRGKIILPMKHALTKVIVNLIPSGMDISKLQGATVKIKVDYPSGTMNLATGAITLGTKSNTDVTLTSHLGLVTPSGTEITSGEDGHPTDISYSSTTYTGYSCSAVILPQTVYSGEANDQTFIELTLIDGSTKYAYLSKDITLNQPGKKYIYNIQVTASGLNVVTTVADWTSAGSAIEDDATLTD